MQNISIMLLPCSHFLPSLTSIDASLRTENYRRQNLIIRSHEPLGTLEETLPNPKVVNYKRVNLTKTPKS
jgi:hypothetical protein